MQISLTPGARAFLNEKGTLEVTVSSLVFSSCCSGPLPPEVKPGPPSDPEGFDRHTVADLTLYFDSLLDPREDLTIDVKEFETYHQLFVQGWE